jgi:preprotein translocase subunit SecF
MIIDWMRYRLIYFAISAIMILISIYALVAWGLELGVDFTGGSVIEYQVDSEISTEELSKNIEELDLQVTSVQTTLGNKYLIKLPPISGEEKQSITSLMEDITGGGVIELRFENVGPSIGPELVRKTIYAIAIAAGFILLWVAYQFKSIKFGASAILAMFHDSFILIGVFAVLGHFMDAEVDFLFVTALLTTLSFSVHDTIVVYDRIRESQKKLGGDLYELANLAITETMVRSLNNSFTIIFMLYALILMGGTTIKWFAMALFIGTILGTYSSPFVAVPLLVTFDRLEAKFRSKNFKFKRLKGK